MISDLDFARQKAIELLKQKKDILEELEKNKKCNASVETDKTIIKIYIENKVKEGK